MAPRYFTPEEANELLPEVRSAAEALVEQRLEARAVASKRAQLVTRIAGNGGDFDPQEPRELEEDFERVTAAMVEAAERLEQLGVIVKDADRGLVDFPALRENGEEVLLCWQVGEDEIAYWHGLEEGFAGRKPLPLD
jgi:hypothetical protein